METRNSEPAAAGIDLAASGLAAAARNLQVFTEEIGRISRLSFAQNAKLIDELSAARDIGDIVAIQTKFMTGMFETFHEQVRLMMSRLADHAAGMTDLAAKLSETGVDTVESAEQAASAAGQAAMSATETMPESYAAGSEGGAATEIAGEAAPESQLGSDDAPASEAAPDAIQPPTTDSAPESLLGSDEARASEAAADAIRAPTTDSAPESQLGSDDAPASEAAAVHPPVGGTAQESQGVFDEESASGAADEAVDWQAPLNEALEVAYRTLEVAVSSMQSGLEARVHVAQAGIDEAIKAAEAAAGVEAAPSLSERSDAPARPAAGCADEE
ncbi:MAG TPA: phasin family protein [Methylovirgula sp.]|nr:phasin family protein [Methylovirgula sp.]